MSEVWKTAMVYSRRAAGSLWRSFLMILVMILLVWLFSPPMAAIIFGFCLLTIGIDLWNVKKGDLPLDSWRVIRSCGEIIAYTIAITYLFFFFGPTGIISGAIGFVLLNILMGIILMIKNRKEYWAAVELLTGIIQAWRKR